MSSPFAGQIIVGVDGSPSSLLAAEYAAAQAGRQRRPLHLVHAYLQPVTYGAIGYAPYDADVAGLLDDARQVIDQIGADLRARHPDLTVHTSVIAGGPAGVLVEQSRAAHLLVVGSRGRGGFAALTLGSVAAQVTSHAHCPVIVVRGERTDPADTLPVYVGVDGSEGSEQALGFAFEEAAMRGVGLVAVYAWVTLPQGALGPADRVKADLAVTEAGAQRVLAESLAGWREKFPDVRVDRELVHSAAPDAVMVDASGRASLVVVGSRGHGGFVGLLLGSISRALVLHSHCPVAVVRRHEPAS